MAAAARSMRTHRKCDVAQRMLGAELSVVRQLRRIKTPFPPAFCLTPEQMSSNVASAIMHAGGG